MGLELICVHDAWADRGVILQIFYLIRSFTQVEFDHVLIVVNFSVESNN